MKNKLTRTRRSEFILFSKHIVFYRCALTVYYPIASMQQQAPIKSVLSPSRIVPGQRRVAFSEPNLNPTLRTIRFNGSMQF